jgi:hypothetical protein
VVYHIRDSGKPVIPFVDKEFVGAVLSQDGLINFDSEFETIPGFWEREDQEHWEDLIVMCTQGLCQPAPRVGGSGCTKHHTSKATEATPQGWPFCYVNPNIYADDRAAPFCYATKKQVMLRRRARPSVLRQTPNPAPFGSMLLLPNYPAVMAKSDQGPEQLW